MVERTQHWRFRYEGPRSAVDDRFCPICIAVATGKNPKSSAALGTPARDGTHSGPDGCPAERVVRAKAAGKTVHCPNHSGLSVALDSHMADHSEHDRDGFQAFAAAALAHVNDAQGGSEVQVEGWGTYDPRLEDGSPDYSQPFSQFSMRIVIPRSAEEQDSLYQKTAPAKRAAEAAAEASTAHAAE